MLNSPRVYAYLFAVYYWLPLGERGFPAGSDIKDLPAMWKTWVWTLGWEDPLKKGIANYSSILAWRNQWTEADGPKSIGSQRVGHDWVSNTFTFFLFTMWIDSISSGSERPVYCFKIIYPHTYSFFLLNYSEMINITKTNFYHFHDSLLQISFFFLLHFYL